MADTLQEFLVNIRYVVDSSSQNSFLEGLKKAALSTKGLALEITGLAAAVLKLSDRFAKAGENLYWMSFRLGSTIESIQKISYVMSNLGVGADEAKQSMEAFGAWTRSMGPAVDGFFKILGVTGKTTTEQYKSLGKAFRDLGLTEENMHGNQAQRQQYAYALAYATSIPGITEKMALALASGEWEHFEEIQERIQKQLGLSAEAMQRWGKISHETENAIRAVGLQMSLIRTSFSLSLNEKMLPVWQHLFDIIEKHMPLIKQLIEIATTAIAMFMHVMVGGLDIIMHVADGFMQIINVLGNLGPGLDIAKAALDAFGLAMLASPIGRFIVLLTILAGLLEDYAVYKEHGLSFIDWGFLDKFSDWSVCIAGIKVDLWSIVAALAAISLGSRVAFGVGLLGLARAGISRLVGGAAGATVAGGAGRVAGAVGARAGLFSLPVIGQLLMGILGANYAWGEAKEHGWDPGAQGHSPVAFGEQAGKDVREWFRKLFGGEETKDATKEGVKSFWDTVTDAVKEFVGIKPAAASVRPTQASPAATVTSPQGPGISSFSGPGAPPLITSLPELSGNPDYGTRANNPGNMDYSEWEKQYGAVGRYQYGDVREGRQHTMAVFKSMQDGIGASVALLIRNQQQYGKTLAGAFHKYATNSYYTQLGFDPNAEFDIKKMAETGDPRLVQLLTSKYGHEGRGISSGQITPDLLRQGIDRAIHPGAIVPQGVAGGPGGQGGRGGVVINQNTTVSVAPGPDAHTTAGHVARAQTRVNEGLVRNTASVVR